MKLTKFPVTAPDGTEYRVKMFEGYSDLYCGRGCMVHIQVPRKLFGFKTVRRCWYDKTYRIYDEANPDYIEIVNFAFAEWAEGVRRDAEAARRVAARDHRRKQSAERLTQWDGRITLNGEES